MKNQVLFTSRDKSKKIKVPSGAIFVGASRVKPMYHIIKELS